MNWSTSDHSDLPLIWFQCFTLNVLYHCCKRSVYISNVSIVNKRENICRSGTSFRNQSDLKFSFYSKCMLPTQKKILLHFIGKRRPSHSVQEQKQLQLQANQIYIYIRNQTKHSTFLHGYILQPKQYFNKLSYLNVVVSKFHKQGN